MSRPGPLSLVLLLVVSALSCARLEEQRASPARNSAAPRASVAPARAEIEKALETLRREETELRARTDFAVLPPSSRSLGSNPYALVELGASRSARFAGVLRGDSAVVLLDAEGGELARSATLPSPSSLAVLPDGRLFVTGDIEPRVARYHIDGARLVSDGDIAIPEAGSLRAVVADARAVFVADFWRDRLYSKALGQNDGAGAMSSGPLCGGPIRLAITARFLGALCLFEHAIVLFERDARGLVTPEIARVTHDGPIWGFSLAEQGDRLFVAAGGVEDHPLDRRDKAFGYVDSFVTVYRLDAARRPDRLFALNTAELGVVTPKVARLDVSASPMRLSVFGYASDTWLELELGPNGDGPPKVRAKHEGMPGCSDVGFAGDTLLCANPLFDAWILLSTSERQPPRLRGNQPSAASPAERLGEALFFTTLMAPDATSEGRRSRFTCETCHFEGGTDGRVHHSGRDDIRVSTRPLLGLFNDAPHFSRAHDPDLTSVSNNEFNVANRGNPIDPWFSLPKKRFPWLAELGVTDEVTEPLALRRALLAFLARFSHAENPLSVRRPLPRRFTSEERRGAELFRAQCERCHAARLVARDASTAVPFERWEALVLSPEGPIVWSNGDYAKTGVLPYVDPNGTQTPSLRRLYLKRPYLTNGSARTLDDLLAAVRQSDSEFAHAAAAGISKKLGSEERQALVAFLEVL